MVKAKAKPKPPAKAKAEPKAKPAAKPAAAPAAKATPKPKPVPKQPPGIDLRHVNLDGYVRDRQARLAALIDKIKADFGEAAAPAIEKLAKRIELLNPVKDCEILRLIEALFM